MWTKPLSWRTRPQPRWRCLRHWQRVEPASVQYYEIAASVETFPAKASGGETAVHEIEGRWRRTLLKATMFARLRILVCFSDLRTGKKD
jgi:hypothetical protein